MTTVRTWLTAIDQALLPLADAQNAAPMQAYMKDVASFLGIKTPERRRAVRTVARSLPRPDAALLADLSLRLWDKPEREYQYVACDLLARFHRSLDASFLLDPMPRLLTTKPWWDTVDGLVTAAICPLTARFPGQEPVMWSWCRSGDRWLIRASIGHQRGRKDATDMDLLLAMCEAHASDREFFIAKAIGWALRDVAPYFPVAVQAFVDSHPALTPVARREALRGLTRVMDQ